MWRTCFKPESSSHLSVPVPHPSSWSQRKIRHNRPQLLSFATHWWLPWTSRRCNSINLLLRLKEWALADPGGQIQSIENCVYYARRALWERASLLWSLYWTYLISANNGSSIVGPKVERLFSIFEWRGHLQQNFSGTSRYLESVFLALQKAQLTLNLNKCAFAQSQILCLEHQVAAEGLSLPICQK